MVSAVVLLLAVLPAVLAKAVPVPFDLELVNFESLGPYDEGDLLLTEDQRNGIPGSTFRWPNAIVPYVLEGGFATNPVYQKLIQDAKADIEKKTCIRMVPYNGTQIDYVAISDAEPGCWSKLGRVGGKQPLNLIQPGCRRVGTAIHELIHAFGFHHEHVRPDRDSYVVINWLNIEKGKEHNFKRQPDYLTYGELYDYGSVMHYTRTSFSTNNLTTIDPYDPNAILGQRVEMSIHDAAKLNAMYNCQTF